MIAFTDYGSFSCSENRATVPEWVGLGLISGMHIKENRLRISNLSSNPGSANFWAVKIGRKVEKSF